MLPILDFIEENIIGGNTRFVGPYGEKKVIYCDYTASGKPLKFIENYIRDFVYPFYANAHTTTSVTSRQTTRFRQEARTIIKKCVNATEEDVVVFTGSGTTSAIHKLIHALQLEERKHEKHVVFVGPFEHHSNILPWKETGAKIVRVNDNEEGTVDMDMLEENLKKYRLAEYNMYVAFSAASNVTGILTDTVAVAELCHKYGALSFWDYASAGPYLNIDMNPTHNGYKDAIFLSPHKFVGGTGTPGLLIAKKSVFKNPVPGGCGGGTVLFVTRDTHLYLKDIEEREEGGTPAIVESIRAGMVFQLKQSVGTTNIEKREEQLCKKAFEALADNPNIAILGNDTASRLPIFSIIIYHHDSSKLVHHNFVSVLLNDLYGIQARGGCACAGPYAQDLLGLNESMARKFTWFLEKHENESVGGLLKEPLEIMKPGFARVGLPYFMNDKTVDFVLNAVNMVATHGWKLLPQYHFDPHTGAWEHKQFKKDHRETLFSLHDVNYHEYGMTVNAKEVCKDYEGTLDDIAEAAKRVFNEAVDINKKKKKMLVGFSLWMLYWVGVHGNGWNQSTALNFTECSSTDIKMKRLLIELSNARKEAYEAKRELNHTKEILNNLTARMTAQNVARSEPHKEKATNKFSGHKLVHLDLGGAPPKIAYLLQLLPYFVHWGATGLLIEYGDTFPYCGELQVIQGPDAYSREQIAFLVREAQYHNLTVIPLVQTFGHLEFVLKHNKFSHLRETAKYTNSICPKNPESVVLVKEMIDQVAQLHPGIKWFHVGADEVWNLKTCRVCTDDQRNKSMIFLEHMIPVLHHVRSKGVTPIMWDDMMRDWTVDFLKEVGKLAEPMIWYYKTDLRRHFPKEMYQRYFEAFPKVWTASAFKGATGPSSDFVTISKHVSNNLQWVEIMSKISKRSEVLGIALTGWSRYDHYGTLCELLPAGIPSLVFCLKTIDEGEMNEALGNNISHELGFSNAIDVEGTQYFNDDKTYGDFPGHEIYELTCKLKDAHHGLSLVHSTEKGWMLKRQQEQKALSYFRLNFAHLKSIQAAEAYRKLRDEASELLSQIYSNNIVTEWISDKIDDRITDAEEQKNRIENVESSYETR